MIPLPWELEEQTLIYLGQCRALGGQQLKGKQIREGWLQKPKEVPDQQVSLSSLSDTSAGTGKTKKEQELLALAKLLKKYGVHRDDSESDDSSPATWSDYEGTSERGNKRRKKRAKKSTWQVETEQEAYEVSDDSDDSQSDADSSHLTRKKQKAGKDNEDADTDGDTFFEITYGPRAVWASKHNRQNRICKLADDKCSFLQKHKCCPFFHASAPSGTTGCWCKLNDETKTYLEQLR